MFLLSGSHRDQTMGISQIGCFPISLDGMFLSLKRFPHGRCLSPKAAGSGSLNIKCSVITADNVRCTSNVHHSVVGYSVSLQK